MCHCSEALSSLCVSNSLNPHRQNWNPLFSWCLGHPSADLKMNHVESVQRNWGDTHLLKLARFCITLAISVSVRDVRSAGYSCIRLNRDGDMMAGHMKRRNREELMRLSARSSLPRSAHLALQDAKTSFSSRGKMLKQEHCSYHSNCQEHWGGKARRIKLRGSYPTKFFFSQRRIVSVYYFLAVEFHVMCFYTFPFQSWMISLQLGKSDRLSNFTLKQHAISKQHPLHLINVT